MTDNLGFKKEAAELLQKLIDFQRKYQYGNKRHAPTSPASMFESELRQMLMIARTDEENKEQKRIDSLC